MEQLSLPLNLPETEPKGVKWFQEMLAALGVPYQPGWSDLFGISLRTCLNKLGHSPIKTLSLFSGGGGLDIAFHDAGFEILQMVEIETKYIQTLQQNSLPGKWLEKSQPICIDIREFSPNPELKVDFIIGGPPCQTFSAAGRRVAGVAGTSDTRGTLFEEYIRLLKTLQPQGFLFENVYGITGANGGKDWQDIQAAFQKANYKIYFRILDAADYGVPQHRERLFIVGLREGNYLFPSPTHGPDSLDGEQYYCAGEAIRGAKLADVELGINGRFGHLLEDIPPGLNYSFYTKEMGYPHPIFSWRSKFSDFLYKADPTMPVRTIKAQGGQYTGPFSWENRRFTIPELKRLQTIPDAYEILGNRQISIEQIGNSVPPQLGRILALSILEQVMGVKLPFPMYYLPQMKKLGFRQRQRQLTAIYAKKARNAISNLQSTGKLKLIPLSGYSQSGNAVRFLSTDFAWTAESIPQSINSQPIAQSINSQSVTQSIKIYLSYTLNDDCWLIKAGLNNLWENEAEFIIDIYPTSGYSEWVLNTRVVKLCAQILDRWLFTSLWKAFEEKIIEVTGKADLVQLSGYYQYNPRISSIMTFRTELPVEPLWRVIQCVTKCIGTSSQLSAEALAELWGVEAENIFGYLQSLRLMGYEVRNHKTNPQISPGEYLIPYAFPTLTPKSVQLRKSLGENHE